MTGGRSDGDPVGETAGCGHSRGREDRLGEPRAHDARIAAARGTHEPEPSARLFAAQFGRGREPGREPEKPDDPDGQNGHEVPRCVPSEKLGDARVLFDPDVYLVSHGSDRRRPANRRRAPPGGAGAREAPDVARASNPRRRAGPSGPRRDRGASEVADAAEREGGRSQCGGRRRAGGIGPQTARSPRPGFSQPAHRGEPGRGQAPSVYRRAHEVAEQDPRQHRGSRGFGVRNRLSQEGGCRREDEREQAEDKAVFRGAAGGKAEQDEAREARGAEEDGRTRLRRHGGRRRRGFPVASGRDDLPSAEGLFGSHEPDGQEACADGDEDEPEHADLEGLDPARGRQIVASPVEQLLDARGADGRGVAQPARAVGIERLRRRRHDEDQGSPGQGPGEKPSAVGLPCERPERPARPAHLSPP